MVRNFLLVLTDHRRLAALAQMIDAFRDSARRAAGLCARGAAVRRERWTSGRKLHCGDELSRLTGKKVRPRFAVEPELIGGVIVRIGSTVYDGSVRGQLDSLGRRLAAE